MGNWWILGPAVLVPLGFFAFIAAIIVIPLTLRAQERARMHETLRRLHESGEPLPPGLLDVLRAGPAPMATSFNSPENELRRGLILIAVALAMVVLGFLIDVGDHYYNVIWPLVGAAAFPGLIGVASLIMWKLGSKLRG